MGMKLLSNDKLFQKVTNFTSRQFQEQDQTVAGAIRTLTTPIPVEDQKIEQFLTESVFTNPKFKPDFEKQ